MKKNANERDLNLLACMKAYYAERGYYPSVREVGEMAGTPSLSVAVYYLDRLERFGLIEREPRLPRAMRFVGGAPELIERKIVKGSVQSTAKKRFFLGVALRGAQINISQRLKVIRRARSRLMLSPSLVGMVAGNINRPPGPPPQREPQPQQLP